MEQFELFPELPPETPALTADKAAAHIAEHARPTEYEDRTSEAARDQGHGPVVPEEFPQVLEDPELNKPWLEDNNYKIPHRHETDNGHIDTATKQLGEKGLQLVRDENDRILGRPGH
jgi:hypothetical protein